MLQYHKGLHHQIHIYIFQAIYDSFLIWDVVHLLWNESCLIFLGAILWVQRQMQLGTDPRTVLQDLLEDEVTVPSDMDTRQVWNAIISMLMEPKPRQKLPNVNTLDDVVQLLKTSKNIMVLTGAGV